MAEEKAEQTRRSSFVANTFTLAGGNIRIALKKQ
jgi:hypothetical protein